MSATSDVPVDPLPDDLRIALSLQRARLGCCAGRIRWLHETSSANDVAAMLAAEGAEEGTTVVAGSQTAGRGRRGRRWFSPPGAGLYVSVIFRPPGVMPQMTLMAGVALAEALRSCSGVPVEIKWPNDLVVGVPGRGSTVVARRKLGGILAEAAGTPAAGEYVVLGFGINLREVDRPPDLAARMTSLEAERTEPVERAAVLVESLSSLTRWQRELAAGQTGAILARWRELSPSCRGGRVEVPAAGAARHGVTAGIDDSGALLVDVGFGVVERLVSGEVRWL